MWQQAKFMRKMDKKTEKLVKGCAIVVSNKVSRLLLATLFKMKKPACPLEVFDDIASARTYLKASKIINNNNIVDLLWKNNKKKQTKKILN